jgi:hypothetical protein
MSLSDLYTCFGGASLGNALGMAASLIKHYPDAACSLGIGSFVGPKHMKTFINYSPSTITQRNMLGISLVFNTYLFYKQKICFTLPGIFDKRPLARLFAASSSSIKITSGKILSKKFDDTVSQYGRQSLIDMGLLEFCIVWGYACATLAYQGTLSFKRVQYSALCALMDVGPSLLYLFCQKPTKKVTNET